MYHSNICILVKIEFNFVFSEYVTFYAFELLFSLAIKPLKDYNMSAKRLNTKNTHTILGTVESKLYVVDL